MSSNYLLQGGRMRLLLLSLIALSTFGCSRYVVEKESTIKLEGAEFSYTVLKNEQFPKHKRIQIKHSQPSYSGKLAKMSFRDRYLKVFGLASKLLAKNCETKVSGFGGIFLSKDPDKDTDPEAKHPQYFNWDFQCQ